MAVLIRVEQKGARVDSIENLIEKHVRSKYPEARISVERRNPPESRADRFAEAIQLIADGKSEIEALRDELQEWLDGLPENLQGGNKASELEGAISELEDVISQCEEVENASVEFPGMY